MQKSTLQSRNLLSDSNSLLTAPAMESPAGTVPMGSGMENEIRWMNRGLHISDGSEARSMKRQMTRGKKTPWDSVGFYFHGYDLVFKIYFLAFC